MRRSLVVLFVLLGTAPVAHALSLEEVLGYAWTRPAVVSARVELRDARASFRQVQNDPLAVRIDIKQAEGRMELAEATLEQAGHAAINEIASAYTSVLQARTQVHLARESVRLSETLLRVAEIRLANGSATRLDLEDAQVALQEARNGLRAAEEGRDLAAENLASLVGAEVGALSPVPARYLGPLPPLEAALKAARRHPTLLQSKAQLELAQLGLNSLDPLYAARTQIGAAQSQLKRARARAQEARRGFALQVRALYTRAENAQASLQLEEVALKNARARLQLQRQRFRSGLIAQVELAQAALGFERTALRHLEARHSYLGALLELQASSMVALGGRLGQAERAGATGVETDLAVATGEIDD